MIERESLIIGSSIASGATSSHETFNVSHDYGLIDVLTQLAYRKSLIAKVTGIVTAGGLVLCLVLPDRFTATAKLMPPQQSPSSASMLMNQLTSSGAGSLAAMAGGGLGLTNPNDIYLGLLNSRPVADAIIRKFRLTKIYHLRDMASARDEFAKYTSI